MDLKECRQKIDEIDRKIVALFEERMVVSEEIASYKIENGLKVFDPSREEEKIAALRAMVKDPENADGIEDLYETILSLSKERQYEIMEEKGIDIDDAEE